MNDIHVDTETGYVTVYAQVQVGDTIVSPVQVGPGETAALPDGSTLAFHPNAVYLNGSGQELMEADGTGTWWVKHAVIAEEGYYNVEVEAAEYVEVYVEGELQEDGSIRVGGVDENTGALGFNIREVNTDTDPDTYTITRYRPANIDPSAGPIDLTPVPDLARSHTVQRSAGVSPFDGTVYPDTEDPAVSTRGQAYTELIAVTVNPATGSITTEVWGTQGTDTSPDAAALIDLEAAAQQLGATQVILNGPRYLLADAGTLTSGEATIQTFGDLEMQRIGSIELDPASAPTSLESDPYVPQTVSRNTDSIYYAGSEIYQLTSPAGEMYVMQSTGTEIESADLAGLGDRLTLPEGWVFEVITLEEPLRVTVSDGDTIDVLVDDLGNAYGYVGIPTPVASLTANPNPAPTGSNITLTATPIVAAAQVVFFRESNGTDGLQNTDTPVGTDSSGADGWTASVNVGNTPGTFTYYAVPVNANGPVGAPMVTTVIVQGGVGDGTDEEPPFELTPHICDASSDFSFPGDLAGGVAGPAGLGDPSYGNVNTEQIQRMLQAPTEGPFYMVNLIRFRDEAVYPDGRDTDLTGREANDLYNADEFIEAIGGQPVFVGEVAGTTLGEEGKWDQVAIVEYPCPAAFFAMSADPGFQETSIHKNAGVEESTVMVTYLDPLEGNGDVDSSTPGTGTGPSLATVQVFNYNDEAQYGDSANEPSRTGEEAMEYYADLTEEVGESLGISPMARLSVEGVIIGDGADWDEVWIDSVPSSSALAAYSTDPAVLAAQYHRDASIEDAYGLVVGTALSSFPTSEDSNDGDTGITSEETYTIDNTAPTVAISRHNPTDEHTNADAVAFLLNFSEDVTNVTADDFEVAASGVATGAITVGDNGDADESTYTVSITSVSGDGVLDLNFTSTQDIADRAGNPLGPGPSTGDENGDDQARVGYEILQVISPTEIITWMNNDQITQEEFDAIELPQGWFKNQPREGTADSAMFAGSPGATSGEFVVAEHFGHDWRHVATIVETNVPLDDDQLLTANTITKSHELTFDAETPLPILISPEDEHYVLVSRDAGRTSDVPTIPEGWQLVEYTTNEELIVQLPDPTINIRADNEDSFQGPIPELASLIGQDDEHSEDGDLYCELMAVTLDDGTPSAEVWWTNNPIDCTPNVWDVDLDQAKEDLGAVEVIVNGPRYMIIDGNELVSDGAFPPAQEVAGMQMIRVASVEADPSQATQRTPYQSSFVDRNNVFTFDVGAEVYELTSDAGDVYIMQSYAQIVDPTLTRDDLPGLGSRLDLPQGWTYSSRILDEPIVLNVDEPIEVLQDNLQNTYSKLSDGEVDDSTEIVEIEIASGPYTFTALTAGPESGELVLLLHGFPQTSFAWRSQLEALGEAGYYAVAPDLRGVSEGARPLGVEDYDLELHIADVLGYADALERETFHLVGHDVGATVAWAVAAEAPERLSSLTALSVPHPDALAEAQRDTTSCQYEASAYFETLSLPNSEDALIANDAAGLEVIYAGLEEEAIDEYKAALGSKEALGAALNFYRANTEGRVLFGDSEPLGSITVDTLYLYGDSDPVLCSEPAEATADLVSGDYRFEVLAGVDHWIPERVPEIVNPTLLEHLEENSDGGHDDPGDDDAVILTTADGVEFVRTPDEQFENLPDWPYEPEYVEIDGLRQAYIDEGPEDGPVVLLLHGQPSWSYLYRDMVPVLVDAGYRVIAMDHLGMGRSDKPTDVDYYTYEVHTDRLEQFIGELGLEDINLFAQDWGSLIGLHVAGENPDWFASIAIGNGALPVFPDGVEVFPPVENPDEIADIQSNFALFPPQQVPFYDENGQLLAPFDSAFEEDYFGDWMTYAMTAASFQPSEVVEAMTWFDIPADEQAAYDAPFPTRAYMAGPRSFPSVINDLPGANDQAWAGLGAYEKPFVTIWGGNDPGNLGRPEVQQQLVAHVPGADGQPHTRLPEASHFLQDDQGEEIATLLIAFYEANGIDGVETDAEILSAYLGAVDIPFPRLLEAITGAEQQPGDDGMPVVFSVQIDVSTLSPEDFEITTASGATTTPTVATLAPADELDELQTVLLAGPLGSADDLPVSVSVVGSLKSVDGDELRGLTSEVSTNESGPALVAAVLDPAEMDANGNETTPARVQTTWQGGVSGRFGSELGRRELQGMRLIDENGDAHRPVGFEDLGDQDNHVVLLVPEGVTPVRVSVEAGTLYDPTNQPNPDTSIEIVGTAELEEEPHDHTLRDLIRYRVSSRFMPVREVVEQRGSDAVDHDHNRRGLLRGRELRRPLIRPIADRISNFVPADVDAVFQSEAFDDVADSLLSSLASELPGAGLRGIGRHLRG
ncbi:MAG: alpha/beta hydrolase [Planctomycetota bacterium]